MGLSINQTKKAIILGIFASISFLPASAQKGSWYAGGDIGLQSSKTKTTGTPNVAEDGKLNTWNFSPEIGTFLSDHVQLGLGLTMSGTKSDLDAGSTNKSFRTGGTLYSRYFFGSGSFRPFAGLNVSVLPGKSTTSLAGVRDEIVFNTTTAGANLNAGFGYALSSKVTVVGSFGALGFSSTQWKNKATGNKTTTSTFGLDGGTLGSRFNVGVYYTFK